MSLVGTESFHDDDDDDDEIRSILIFFFRISSISNIGYLSHTVFILIYFCEYTVVSL